MKVDCICCPLVDGDRVAALNKKGDRAYQTHVCPDGLVVLCQEGAGDAVVRLTLSVQRLQGGGVLHRAPPHPPRPEGPPHHTLLPAGHGLPHQGMGSGSGRAWGVWKSLWDA